VSAPAPAPSPPPAPAPPPSWGERGQRGIEVEVRLGAMMPNTGSPVRSSNLYPGNMVVGDPTGDILEGKESPYGPALPGVAVTLGYRFLPFLSAGVSFSYGNFFVNDGTDTGDYSDSTSQLERQYWSLAVYGRYYLVGLHPRLEPWIELGVGYSDDNANYYRARIQTMTGSAETQQYLLEEQGLVTSLTLGLDWRLASFLSVGPSIGWAQTFSTKACATDNVDSMSPVVQITNRCVNQESPTAISDPVTPTLMQKVGAVNGTNYGVFFGAVYAKLTFLGP
jgi:hypothetical protein